MVLVLKAALEEAPNTTKHRPQGLLFRSVGGVSCRNRNFAYIA